MKAKIAGADPVTHPMSETITQIDKLTRLIETAENRKLLSRVKNPLACNLEVRSQLQSDLRSLKRMLPSDYLDKVFSFFFYLRTESVSPASGVKDMYEYFAKSVIEKVKISIITWDCPGCAEPYVVDGEITRNPLDTEIGAVTTLQRRRFVTRSDLAKDLLKIIDPLQEDIPINFYLITAGLNAKTYYPKSVASPMKQESASKAVGLFTNEYQKWANTTFGKLSFPIVTDLNLYPLAPDSQYWRIYEKIVLEEIPIPEFVMKKQMEINERITGPLSLNNTLEAKLLAKRVIAAYGAEGVILDELKPRLGNIIIAATEAISVYYQRSNFARQYLGLKPLPTFYTLYD